MPELPDVETYRKKLQKKALRHTINDIKINKSKVVKISKKEIKSLTGHRFTDTSRKGKLCFLKSGNNKWLVLHFGMTGDVKAYKKKEKEPDYAAATFILKGKNNVSIISKRKLGKIELCDSPEAYAEKNKIGVDALECTKKHFMDLLQKKKGNIKSALMDQSLISGLGNVYTDEILYQSGIHPKQKVEKLEDKELKRLHSKMRSVLSQAIKKEAQPDKFPPRFLIPHRDKNESCPGCKGKVKKITVSGRSTYFCPSCQQK